MFSIIIVGYNVEKTIKRALDSVFFGNASNSFELIYVDDGSCDKTRDIVDKYSEKHRIKKIYLKENTGIFNARCEGIKNATCDYSLFLDADDELKNGTIDVITKTINNKKFDICEYGINVVYNDGYILDKSIIENYYNKASEKVRNNDLLSECFLEERIKVNVWNKIYKTDLLKKILEYNIYDHVYLEEDQVISLITLNKCKKYHKINNKLVNYYAGGGISTTYLIKTKEQTAKRASAIKSLLIVKKYISEELDNYQNPELLELITNKLWQYIFRDMYYNCDSEYRNIFLNELLKYTDIYTILINFANILSINTFPNPVDVVNKMLECEYSEYEAYHFLTDLLAKYESTSKKPVHNLTQVDVNTIKEIFFNSTTWKLGGFFTYIPRKLKDQYLEKLASESKAADSIFVPVHKKEGYYNFIALKTIVSKNSKIQNVDKLLNYEYSCNPKYIYFCDYLDQDSISICKYCKENKYDLVIFVFKKADNSKDDCYRDVAIISSNNKMDTDIFSCMNVFDGVIVNTNKAKEICNKLKNIDIKMAVITNQNIDSLKVKCIKKLEGNLSSCFDWLNSADVDVSKDLISVVIPTYNAGDELRELLLSIKNQRIINPAEIVIVDSGSSDNTLTIAEEFDTTIINITQNEFSHSKARNLGAENAKGNYVLFTVQDALPYNPFTFYILLKKLKSYKRAAAISPSQEGRRDCDLYYEHMLDVYKYDYFNNFNSDVRTLPTVKDYYHMRTNSSLDDVMCLFNKKVFDKNQYRLDYAEDCDISVRLLKQNYILLKTKDTKVLHSHNRSPYYFLKRNVVDLINIIKIYPNTPIDFFDLDRLINYTYLMYVWYILFFKYINLNEYQFKNYNTMIINVNKICNRIEYNLERISNKDYSKQIKNNVFYDKEYKKVIKFLYKRIDYLKVDNNELVNMTEFLKNRLCHACYLLEDYDYTSNDNKALIIQFLLKTIAAQTGQALGCYYIKNKGIDNEIDLLILKLKNGI